MLENKPLQDIFGRHQFRCVILRHCFKGMPGNFITHVPPPPEFFLREILRGFVSSWFNLPSGPESAAKSRAMPQHREPHRPTGNP